MLIGGSDHGLRLGYSIARQQLLAYVTRFFGLNKLVR